MNSLYAEQIRRNLLSRDAWDRFSTHRQQVTQLLKKSAAPHNSRLCVLGAGNCNDIDLTLLLQDSFSEVLLIDQDEQALKEGMQRQALADETRIRYLSQIDLTAVQPKLARWAPSASPTSAEIHEIVRSIETADPSLGIPNNAFNVVTSICTLTQLVDAVVKTLGERHPSFLDVVTAVRLFHLRSLLALTTPGGSAILITDIVSSDTFPTLPQVPAEQLPAVVTALINAKNFFTGVNPFVLTKLFREHPGLSPLCDNVTLTPPWLWNLGPRVYAVCAVVVQRSAIPSVGQ